MVSLYSISLVPRSVFWSDAHGVVVLNLHRLTFCFSGPMLMVSLPSFCSSHPFTIPSCFVSKMVRWCVAWGWIYGTPGLVWMLKTLWVSFLVDDVQVCYRTVRFGLAFCAYLSIHLCACFVVLVGSLPATLLCVSAHISCALLPIRRSWRRRNRFPRSAFRPDTHGVVVIDLCVLFSV
ncbi:hypothetical protein BCR34DRAFT_326295 [Clohesyomyces aquaticus]|uniref:Uncharacterized protein n=1 Tax=Clohesyomyces aquaticus TaxID=1231657 RepID=A0A1Y1ZMD8_9PLEO|nr:hypothetical protein BCR34DRAFT_326295 [Clohesyomyces aquaticus]